MDQPTTKQQLLDVVESTHQDLVRLLASMSDDEKTAPILQDGWSVQDSLAHLVAWEKMTLQWMSASLRGEHVKRFIPGYQYDTEAQREPVMEALNQYLYRENKMRPLDEVMQDFRTTHRVIYNLIAQLEQDDIFDPNRFAWRNGSPALDMLGGNTYDHYAEHQGWIMEWRARQGQLPGTKAELLERIRARHAEMEQLIGSLSPAQLTAPALDDEWSVKDNLAHISAWENRMLEDVHHYQSGSTIPEMSEQQMHALNQQLYEQNRDRALDDVVGEFRQTHIKTIADIVALDDREIFDPNYFRARKGRPLLNYIAGDTYEHYDEHLGYIRAGFANLVK